ncbi:MAG: hypothetical protein LQ351_003126 [Letrouitia transgressa]|nr:MAG: hypothetical protein LQ351_003126 [Letrouitia transgressa]
MPKDPKIGEFPDIGSKLQAPIQKSTYERNKAEAEAKRQREQDETAAVYKEFVKSFNNDDEKPSSFASRGSGSGSSVGRPGVPQRHFPGGAYRPPGRGRNSGPGTLGPPPSLSRKRPSDQGIFAYDDAKPLRPKSLLQTSDDEDDADREQEIEIPKPTLKMFSLPPGTSPSFIKSLIPPNLNIEDVRIVTPSGPGNANSTERRSLSAVVTLAMDTPGLNIDTAVGSLQNKYLGKGYFLTLSRHLSSTVKEREMPKSLTSSKVSLPFGAKPIPAGPGSFGGRGSRGPHRGGFAPPSSYTSSRPGHYSRNEPQHQVTVTPKSHLTDLKLIHSTVERVVKYGPGFEALLITKKEVQLEERWAWLWDARSPGGVYYRWRIWESLTGASIKHGGRHGIESSSQRIFGGEALWSAPEKGLPFEYVTRFEDLLLDVDYDSSDEEDDGGEGRRKYAHYHGGAPPPDGRPVEGDEQAYLNPLKKAKLTHLLARLPTTNAKLRRGDVARVTAFAMQHAGEGTDEVVQMVVSNISKPFAFTSANPGWKGASSEAPLPKEDEEGNEENKKPVEKEDTSSAMLVGLYLVTDILSSCQTSGVRNIWRYRQIFQGSLTQNKVFEVLGRLEKTMHWGRLRADQWKRKVGVILSVLDKQNAFSHSSQEHFSSVFANPPLTAAEEEAKAAAENIKKASAAKSRWKSFDRDTQQDTQKEKGAPPSAEAVDAMDIDLDGETIAEDDEDIDGEPMADSDNDVVESSAIGKEVKEGAISEPKGPVPQGDNPNVNVDIDADKLKTKPVLLSKGKQRPKAEDMFADSD